jgi:hypothetical protein
MKRILTICTVALASLMFSMPASAEGGYFGVRGDGLIPLATTVSGFPGLIVLPLLGFQGGYDFGDVAEPGFGVRGTLRTLVIINELSLDALYRIPTDETGAGWYFGAGGDVVFVVSFGVGGGAALFGAHGVAGYNFPISDTISAFVEAQPGGYFAGVGSLFYVSFGAGFNFHFNP